MFEAITNDGSFWKRIVDSVKDLVTEVNFDCSPAGISIQAMDSSHVALVHLLIMKGGLAGYQCEDNDVMGLNLESLGKVLKCVQNGDRTILRHMNDSDTLTVETESKDNRKSQSFTLKLMQIETEAMGIPEIEYTNSITLPSAEFRKICSDMNAFGDTVTIDVNRDGVKFSASGDIGEGYALLRVGQHSSSTNKVKKEGAVKSEVKPEVKPEVKEEINEDAPLNVSMAHAMKTENKDEDALGVEIQMDGPVTHSFALRYLNTFAKASVMTDRMKMHFSQDAPCMIEFPIAGEGNSYLRYYLAPKVDESEA